MEAIIGMVLLLVLGVPAALFIWLGITASRADRSVRELESRFDALQAEVYSLWRELRTRGTAPSAAPTREQPEPAPVPIAPPPEQTEPSPEPTEVTSPPAAIPPPIPEPARTTQTNHSLYPPCKRSPLPNPTRSSRLYPALPELGVSRHHWKTKCRVRAAGIAAPKSRYPTCFISPVCCPSIWL